MKGFKVDIEKAAVDNKNFRKVLYTSPHLQLVLMSLKGGEEIGEEVHDENDQFFRVEAGRGKCIIDGNEYEIKDGDVIVVPAGASHNVINVDDTQELKLYTIYAPPHHRDGVVHKTKAEAEEFEEEYDNVTSEM